jgi:tetratricopeptide (TPR) repeat protein
MTEAGSAGPLALARHYAAIGQPQRVLEALERLESAHDAEALALRGEALYQVDRYEEGADAARRGLELEPEHPVLLDVLALNLIELDELGAAEQALLAALGLWPDDTTLICHYALACARGGQFDKARRLVERAAQLGPEDVDVLRVRAQVAQLSGDRKASKYIDELLAVEPDDRAGHMLRGNVLVERSDIRGAVRHFEHATRLDPTDHDTAHVTRYNRTLTHWSQWPLWPIQRFGPLKVWGAYILFFVIASAAGVITYVWPLIVLYLLLVVYSWTFAPLSRWWLRRKL